MRIKAFTSLGPPPAQAPQVAAVPYDVVDTGEARALTAGNASSFLRITRPEVDLPPGTDEHDARVYEQASRTFAAFRRDGLLVENAVPSLFVYRLGDGDHTQCGIVACCHVDDYEQGVIRRHETTRIDKEDDRVRHMAALNANASPVFLAYRDSDAVDRGVAAVTAREPDIEFTAADGVTHAIWSVADSDAIVDAFAGVPEAYIADGHHRAAAAARFRAEQGAGGTECDGFMAILFPAGQLRILAYNRTMADLNGLTPDAFMETVEGVFTVTPGAAPVPPGAGHSSMYFQGQWYDLAWDVPAGADPASALDVSVLQDRLLGPILGVVRPREDMRLRFIGGDRGADDLVRRVDSGEAVVAFSMYPVAVEQIMAVADAGGIMPPKSTWFSPKPRSGLIVHPF